MKCKKGYTKHGNRCIRNTKIKNYCFNQGYNLGGVGFFSLLGLLFIGLKLSGIIKWSWLWVLSPLWIPFSLGVIILLIFIIIGYIATR